jgi:hypothetical protein
MAGVARENASRILSEWERKNAGDPNRRAPIGSIKRNSRAKNRWVADIRSNTQEANSVVTSWQLS